MQREHLRRGFSIYVSSLPNHLIQLVLTPTYVYTSHQKVVLEVDFSGSLWVSLRVLMSLVLCNTLPQGYTEITVVPTSKDLKAIHLHARQCGTCRSLAFDYARSAL